MSALCSPSRTSCRLAAAAICRGRRRARIAKGTGTARERAVRRRSTLLGIPSSSVGLPPPLGRRDEAQSPRSGCHASPRSDSPGERGWDEAFRRGCMNAAMSVLDELKYSRADVTCTLFCLDGRSHPHTVTSHPHTVTSHLQSRHRWDVNMPASDATPAALTSAC